MSLTSLLLVLATAGCARDDALKPPPAAGAQAAPIGPATPLGDFVAREPVAARVLMRHRIDFCCGGRRTLGEAAKERGVEVGALLAEVRAEAATADDEDRVRWDQKPIAELADHIVARYHTRLREDLPRLLELSRRVDVAHAGRPERPVGLTAHIEAIAADVTKHLQAEEQVLWPRIRAGTARAGEPSVRDLFADHETLGRAIHRTRAMTDDFTPPAVACPTWRALYAGLEELETEIEMHVHLENNVLFPRLPV